MEIDADLETLDKLVTEYQFRTEHCRSLCKQLRKIYPHVRSITGENQIGTFTGEIKMMYILRRKIDAECEYLSILRDEIKFRYDKDMEEVTSIKLLIECGALLPETI